MVTEDQCHCEDMPCSNHTVGLKEDHVRKCLENHLTPHFDGTKVVLQFDTPEAYEGAIKSLVWVAAAANMQEG